MQMAPAVNVRKMTAFAAEPPGRVVPLTQLSWGVLKYRITKTSVSKPSAPITL